MFSKNQERDKPLIVHFMLYEKMFLDELFDMIGGTKADAILEMARYYDKHKFNTPKKIINASKNRKKK